MAFGGRVLVVCFFASLSVAVFAGHGTTPKPDAIVHHNSVPGSVHDICAVAPHDVLKHSNTKEYCDRRPFWADRMIQRGTGHVQDCHLDKDNKIVCDRKETCEGGYSGGYDATATMTNLTYDCDSMCGHKGSLLISCCEACLRVHAKELAPVNGYAVNKIVCLGCSNPELEKAAKNDASCETSGKDKYNCKSEETCKAGVPLQHTFMDNYTCHIEDCNACDGSQQLKAACCSTCLAKACASDHTATKGCVMDPVTKAMNCDLKIVSAGDRYACLGCIVAHPIPVEVHHPVFAIILFLILVSVVVAGIIFTPKAQVCDWCKTKQYGWHQKRKFAVKTLKRHLSTAPGGRVEPGGYEEARVE